MIAKYIDFNGMAQPLVPGSAPTGRASARWTVFCEGQAWLPVGRPNFPSAPRIRKLTQLARQFLC